MILFPCQKDHTESSVENQLGGIENLKEKKKKVGSNPDSVINQMYDYRQALNIIITAKSRWELL